MQLGVVLAGKGGEGAWEEREGPGPLPIMAKWGQRVSLNVRQKEVQFIGVGSWGG